MTVLLKSLMAPGSEGVMTMPSTPTSRVWAKSLASSGSLAPASTSVLERWNSAMRFSRGMTFQSFAAMTTNSTLSFRAEALARSSGRLISTIIPTLSSSMYRSSPRLSMAWKRPRRRSSLSSCRTTMSTSPASSAAVTTFFLCS